jgi:hypothetical protein
LKNAVVDKDTVRSASMRYMLQYRNFSVWKILCNITLFILLLFCFILYLYLSPIGSRKKSRSRLCRSDRAIASQSKTH